MSLCETCGAPTDSLRLNLVTMHLECDPCWSEEVGCAYCGASDAPHHVEDWDYHLCGPCAEATERETDMHILHKGERMTLEQRIDQLRGIEPMNEPTTDEIAELLISAKAQVDEAQAAYDGVRQMAVETLGTPDEGTESHKGATHVVRITQPVSRRVEKGEIYRLKEALPESVFDAIVAVEPKVVVRELKSLATLDPDSYRIASRYITSKPGKPQVRAEVID